MKRILWWLMELIDNNHGYSTPIQKRFRVGDKKMVSPFVLRQTALKQGETVTIIETGRHDYLVLSENGKKEIVYQFEIE